MALISAHRCGAGDQAAFDNTLTGIRRAVDGPAEYVEFDVQRCADGALVLAHDAAVLRAGRPVAISALTRAELTAVAGEVCAYEDALVALAGHKAAHIDLKFSSPADDSATPDRTAEVGAAQLAREILGEQFIITSLEDRSVRAVRDWADAAGVGIAVGLSLGRGLGQIPWAAWPGLRLSELAPARRVAASRANLIAAHHRLARVSLARYGARRALPLLVWTVDEPRDLRAWLSDPRVWMLVTNRPVLAAEIRDELAAGVTVG